MATDTRELKVMPKAVETLSRARPSAEELESLGSGVRDLKRNPKLGYPVPFSNPQHYRFDIGRFKIHYVFDDSQIVILIIGDY